MRQSLTRVPDKAIWRTSESVLNNPENAPNPRNKKTANENPVPKPICLTIKRRDNKTGSVT